MKVILTRDVPKVGRDGEIVTVANGYARNYLFPRQLALVAKGAVMKQHEDRITREATKSANLLADAQRHGEALRGHQFQIIAKANARSTRLFGSVTEADVAEAIKRDIGVDVDKRKISLIDPIKLTGAYELTAKLHTDVIIPFSIEVTTREQLDAREKARVLAEEKAAKEAARAAEAEAAAIIAAEAAREARAAREAAEAANPQPAAPHEPNRRESRRRDRETQSMLDEAPDAEG
jgi:large subunit ribosomal protein L9